MVPLERTFLQYHLYNLDFSRKKNNHLKFFSCGLGFKFFGGDGEQCMWATHSRGIWALHPSLVVNSWLPLNLGQNLEYDGGGIFLRPYEKLIDIKELIAIVKKGLFENQFFFFLVSKMELANIFKNLLSYVTVQALYGCGITTIRLQILSWWWSQICNRWRKWSSSAP